MKNLTRIVFTQGGKGGVGKTELQLSLIPWFHTKGHRPLLMDFDIENTNRSGLQNFYPEAEKYDVHSEGALDQFFDICDQSEHSVILADLGSGAGEATYKWFHDVFEDANDLGIRFTAIGVTTNEAGAVHSVLKWADHLQDKVDYLIVLNEMRERDSDFQYWYEEPAVSTFTEILCPKVIRMKARMKELQAELRNHTTTLERIIQGQAQIPFFQKTRNIVRAKAHQKDLFDGFESAKSILLPPEI